MPKKIPNDFKERFCNNRERLTFIFDDETDTNPKCKSKKSRKKVPDEEEEIILIAEELDDSNSDIDDDDCLTDSIRRLKKRVYNNYDELFVKYFKITADKNSYVDADDLHKIFSDGKYMDNSNKIVLQQYLKELGITMRQSKGYDRYHNVKYKIY
jgi:hypothetical protein